MITMGKIVVVGSSNTDMVLRVSQIPRPGQTISGGELKIYGGGKGANQAIAAHRAGSDVCFIAAVGDDDLGNTAVETLRAEGLDISSIQALPDVASGVAFIFVDDQGENSIGVAPGANACLSAQIVEANHARFDVADVVLMQLETPLDSIRAAKAIAVTSDCKVIINPAPATDLPDELLDGLYCLTPNESEAAALSGIGVIDTDSAERAADVLLGKGIENVVITLGGKGALLKNADGVTYQPANPVEVVDTTGAGDTFNGYFAASIANGLPLKQALELAVRAASLSVQSAGAIASIPTSDQVSGKPLSDIPPSGH